MKAWFKELFKRIGDLILKVLAFKTLVFFAVFMVALRNPSELNTIVVGITGMFCVGARTALKYRALVKGE